MYLIAGENGWLEAFNVESWDYNVSESLVKPSVS